MATDDAMSATITLLRILFSWWDFGFAASSVATGVQL
jgi:hypothetical protein